MWRTGKRDAWLVRSSAAHQPENEQYTADDDGLNENAELHEPIRRASIPTTLAAVEQLHQYHQPNGADDDENDQGPR